MRLAGVRANSHAWSAAAAEAAHLGEFRREHEERNAISGAVIGWTFLLAVIPVYFLALHAQWLAILIIVALAVFAVLGYLRLPMFAPSTPSSLTDPMRVAVYERGLVLDGGFEPARAVRWAEIAGLARASTRAYRVSYLWPGTVSASFTVGRLSHRAALVACLARRTAVPVRYWPRAVLAGLGAVAIAVYVWQLVLPEGEPSVIGQLPSDSYGLQAACEGAGVVYSSAAAYAGGGPHPVIVFSDNEDVAFSAQWTPANPAGIQLVACVNRDGNTSLSSTMCSYSATGLPQSGPFGVPDGSSETDFVNLAEYQITVYTLRTHQEVGTARVVGGDTTCPSEKELGTTIYSQLTDAQLHQVLDSYVNRPA